MKEKRYSENLQIRSDTDNKVIEGYFVLFDKETELYSGYYEKISRTAIKNISKDIRALVNHDSNIVLGRTTNDTLQLRVDDIGLYGKIIVNENDTEAMNLYERVKRGDISQCSFGFFINEKKNSWQNDDLHIEITDLELVEVSVVTFPAYEDTRVNARSILESERLKVRKEKLKEKTNDIKSNFFK